MNIQILLFEGFDELDVVAPYEILRSAAAKGADFKTECVSLSGSGSVKAAHGLTLMGQGNFQLETADLIVVPGGGWNDGAPQGVRAEIASNRIPKMLHEAHRQGKILASVCTGALLLAAAGLLKGRPCTTHHSAWKDLEASGAKLIKQRVVDDGDMITSGGVTSGIDLGLALVARFAGAKLSEEIGRILEYPHAP